MHRLKPGALARLIVPALLSLLLLACSHRPPGADAAPVPNANHNPEALEIDTAETMRDHALRDLSRRLRVAVAEIEVRSAEAVTWSDGALGCPQPGFAYTQALVPGYQVVLAVGDTEYHYHGGSHGRPFLCPEDRRQAPLEAHQTPAHH